MLNQLRPNSIRLNRSKGYSGDMLATVGSETVQAPAEDVVHDHEPRTVKPADAKVDPVRKIVILQGVIAVLEIQQQVRGKDDLMIAHQIAERHDGRSGDTIERVVSRISVHDSGVKLSLYLLTRYLPSSSMLPAIFGSRAISESFGTCPRRRAR